MSGAKRGLSRRHQKRTSLFSETWCSATGLISASALWPSWTGARLLRALLTLPHTLAVFFFPSLALLYRSASQTCCSCHGNRYRVRLKQRRKNKSSLVPDVPHLEGLQEQRRNDSKARTAVPNLYETNSSRYASWPNVS